MAIHDPTSTLVFYRRVLRLRAQLPTTERLTWAQTSNDSTHFARERLALGDGLGLVPIAPATNVAITSGPLSPDGPPEHTTAWIAQGAPSPRGQLSFITA